MQTGRDVSATHCRQVAEFQVRVVVLNGFTALGMPIIEAAGYVCPRKGVARP
jgi:hypothetical protein